MVEKTTKLKIEAISRMPEPTAFVPLMAWNQTGKLVVALAGNLEHT